MHAQFRTQCTWLRAVDVQTAAWWCDKAQSTSQQQSICLFNKSQWCGECHKCLCGWESASSCSITAGGPRCLTLSCAKQALCVSSDRGLTETRSLYEWLLVGTCGVRARSSTNSLQSRSLQWYKKIGDKNFTETRAFWTRCSNMPPKVPKPVPLDAAACTEIRKEVLR